MHCLRSVDGGEQVLNSRDLRSSSKMRRGWCGMDNHDHTA